VQCFLFFYISVPPQGVFSKAKDEDKVKYYGLNQRTKLWQYGSADIIYSQPDCVKERKNWYSHIALTNGHIAIFLYPFNKDMYDMFCFAAKPKTNLSIVGNRTKKALNEPLELPMSPCTPSKLDLVTSQTQHRYIFNRFVIQSTVYFQII